MNDLPAQKTSKEEPVPESPSPEKEAKKYTTALKSTQKEHENKDNQNKGLKPRRSAGCLIYIMCLSQNRNKVKSFFKRMAFCMDTVYNGC